MQPPPPPAPFSLSLQQTCRRLLYTCNVSSRREKKGVESCLYVPLFLRFRHLLPIFCGFSSADEPPFRHDAFFPTHVHPNFTLSPCLPFDCGLPTYTLLTVWQASPSPLLQQQKKGGGGGGGGDQQAQREKAERCNGDAFIMSPLKLTQGRQIN